MTEDESTPRWVKVFGIIALAIIVMFLVVHRAGGGFHRHMQ